VQYLLIKGIFLFQQNQKIEMWLIQN